MVRWEPGARERLQAAALELFTHKGFDETTATEIAQAAGLTERTFFRYFADKREVIFAGQDLFQQAFMDGLDATPDGTPALDAIAAAVESAAGFFPADRHAYSRQRHAVITANPVLQERELLKMASLAAALAAALRKRGVPDPTATLSAESGVTVFRLAYEQWLAGDAAHPFADYVRALFVQLTRLTAASAKEAR